MVRGSLTDMSEDSTDPRSVNEQDLNEQDLAQQSVDEVGDAESIAGTTHGDQLGDETLGGTTDDAPSGETLGGSSGDTAVKDPEDWVTGDEPMTGAQRSYLDTLAREAGEELPADLTKAQASEHIERLQQKTGRGQ